MFLFAWVVGAGILFGTGVLLVAIGYLIRNIVPTKDRTSLFKNPSYKFDGMDITASFIVGGITTLVLTIPLVIGLALI